MRRLWEDPPASYRAVDTQTGFHDARYPSRPLLPVVAR
jgi:hypothetical protein